MKKIENYIELHIIVIILGFTAILGKLIQLPAPTLVWYRTMFAFIALFIWFRLSKTKFILPARQAIKLLGIGLIVGAHWIFFFHAIKVSNVSVTLGCLASGTLFASLLEPLIFKRRIYWFEVLLGLVIIIGLYLIFQFETKYIDGIIFSLIAFFLSSLFTVLNKKITVQFNQNVIGFYEMIGGFIGVTIYLFINGNLNTHDLSFSWKDFIFLALLAVICSAYAFSAVVRIMKVVSAYAVVLSINLEPVYGIVLAYFIFGSSEYMTTGFYFGTIILLAAIFLYPMLSRKFIKNDAAGAQIPL
ncbi:MAG: EamA family transporter [Bacteroidales bacterium]